MDLPLFLLLSGPAGVSPHAAKGLGYLAGTLVGFLGNKFWTFDSRRRGVHDMLARSVVVGEEAPPPAV